MTPEQFCYWLQGWREINRGQPPDLSQWMVIRDHLDLVFNKQTPYYPPEEILPTSIQIC